MGLFSFGKKLLGAAGSLSKIPVLGNAVKAIPVVGTVASVASIGSDLLSARSRGGGGGGMPALPMPGGMGMPGVNAPAPVGMGQRSIFRDDPNVIEALKQYAISERYLRPYYRAPRGAVIVYDQVGKPYGLPRDIAKKAGLWKPAKKPPISVRDWQSIQRADRTITKMKKVFARTARVEHNVKGGKVRVHARKKGS